MTLVLKHRANATERSVAMAASPDARAPNPNAHGLDHRRRLFTSAISIVNSMLLGAALIGVGFFIACMVGGA